MKIFTDSSTVNFIFLEKKKYFLKKTELQREGEREIETETDRERIFHLLVYFSDGFSDHG